MQRCMGSLLLIAVGSVTSLTADTSAIGIAATNGLFQVNDQEARGTATLFDGSVVETGKAPSQIRLGNGAQVRLAAYSRAKVYESRIVLEKGAGQLESSSAFPIESRSLHVFSTEPNTVARVLVADQGKVVVSTIRGSVRVTNSAGLAVANVTTSLSMAFDPQVGAAAPARLAGCVYERDGKDFIFDAATKTAHGISGSGLARQMGKNVELTGIEDPTTHVINVTIWKQLASGECRKFAAVAQQSGVETAVKTVGASGGVAAAAGAAGTGAAAGAGVALGTVAVVGGVATAATVGGLAASGSFSGSNSPSSTSP